MESWMDKQLKNLKELNFMDFLKMVKKMVLEQFIRMK